MTESVLPHWKAIVAMADNRVIGAANDIPWHLPRDFRFFKETTLGHVLAMGRHTWDSLGGRPLPGRETVVISRTLATLDGATVLPSLDALAEFDAGGRTVFISGGAEIYRRAFPRCAELLLSRVHATPPGDIRLPSFEHLFVPAERLLATEDFETIRLVRR